jgi:uncharacterized protein (TIGR02453 family)
MSSKDRFAGFSQKGLSFFRDLSANNNREWFMEHKQVYLQEVIVPAQLFLEALGDQLKSVFDEIQYDTRTNGRGSILRIYRDTRFSPDKSPYNTHLRIVFWSGPDKKGEGPAFYFGLDHTGARLYAGIHIFTGTLLSVFRERIDDQIHGADLEQLLAAVRAAGDYEIGGSHYKRVPAGFDKDHQRAELLKHKGLYALSPNIDPNTAMSRELVDRCVEHGKHMMPLVKWLFILVATSAS